MFRYNLKIADIKIVLNTVSKINIPDRLGGFLCADFDKEDCVINVRTVKELPGMSEKGCQYGPDYYDYTMGNLKIFHSESVGGQPFSVTEFFEKKIVDILVKEEYLQYFDGIFGIFNRIAFEYLLLKYSGLMLHSSFVKYNGMGIVFAGPSGVGKSTQADLWKDNLGAKIINGDRSVLRKSENNWNVYGSLFSGTSGICLNDNAPLKAIVILKQSENNKIEKLSPAKAMLHIYPEISVNRADENIATKTAELCMKLISDIPVYRLECRPDKDAVYMLKKELNL